MRPTKDPEFSPLFEQIVRTRLQETNPAALSNERAPDAKQPERLTQLKKTVKKARELLEPSRQAAQG
jgi:hypothetical protein